MSSRGKSFRESKGDTEGENPFAEIAATTAVLQHEDDDMADVKADSKPDTLSSTAAPPPAVPTPNYYKWDEICPEMIILKNNIPTLLDEIVNVPHVSALKQLWSIQFSCNSLPIDSGFRGPKTIFRWDPPMNGLCSHFCIHFRHSILMQGNWR
jgi:hypothetical protein